MEDTDRTALILGRECGVDLRPCEICREGGREGGREGYCATGCIHVDGCVCVCVCACMRVRMHVRVRVRVRVCVCVCMCVCACACVCVCHCSSGYCRYSTSQAKYL